MSLRDPEKWNIKPKGQWINSVTPLQGKVKADDSARFTAALYSPN